MNEVFLCKVWDCIGPVALKVEMVSFEDSWTKRNRQQFCIVWTLQVAWLISAWPFPELQLDFRGKPVFRAGTDPAIVSLARGTFAVSCRVAVCSITDCIVYSFSKLQQNEVLVDSWSLLWSFLPLLATICPSKLLLRLHLSEVQWWCKKLWESIIANSGCHNVWRETT